MKVIFSIVDEDLDKKEEEIYKQIDRIRSSFKSADSFNGSIVLSANEKSLVLEDELEPQILGLCFKAPFCLTKEGEFKHLFFTYDSALSTK